MSKEAGYHKLFQTHLWLSPDCSAVKLPLVSAGDLSLCAGNSHLSLWVDATQMGGSGFKSQELGEEIFFHLIQGDKSLRIAKEAVCVYDF